MEEGKPLEDGKSPVEGKSLKRQRPYINSPISIELKMAILEAVDTSDRKKIDIAKDFQIHGINQSTFFSILSQREKVFATVRECGPNLDRKRVRARKFSDVEKVLTDWYKKTQSAGVTIHRAMVKNKALEIGKELNHADFVCDKGWLRTFKKRQGFEFEHIPPDLLQEMNPVTCKLVGQENVGEILRGYAPCDVYAVGSFSLYWSALPSSCTFQPLQQGILSQIDKRVTILIGSNMDGSDKLKLRVVLDKTGQNLDFLQEIQSKCPVSYTYSHNAAMTPQIFTQWVKHLDKLFYAKRRKVCLVVSESDGFPPLNGVKALKCVCLPLKDSIQCQPCQQGIVLYFKTLYRLRLVQRLACVSSKSTAFTLMDALHLMKASWKDCPIEQIELAFESAGFQIEVAFGSTQQASNVSCNRVPGTSEVKVEYNTERTLASTVSFINPASSSTETSSKSTVLDSIRKSLDFPSNIKKLSLNLTIDQFGTVDKELENSHSYSVINNNDNSNGTVSSSAPPNGMIACLPSSPPTQKQAKEAAEILKRYFESQLCPDVPIAKQCLESVTGIRDAMDLL